MAAIEPDLALADQRPGRELLEPRRPFGPAHCRAQCRRWYVQRLLVAEQRDRERSIHRLVATAQPRKRKVQAPLLVPVAKLSLARDRVPGSPARQPWRTPFGCNRLDSRGDGRRIELRDER